MPWTSPSKRKSIRSSAAPTARRVDHEGMRELDDGIGQNLADPLEHLTNTCVTPDRKLHQLIVSFVHTILDDLHGTALFLDIKALGPRYLRLAVARRDQFDQGVRRVIQQGIDWGTFDPKVNAKLLSFAMLGAVNWIPRWYSPEGPASSQIIADRFAGYLIAGLRAR